MDIKKQSSVREGEGKYNLEQQQFKGETKHEDANKNKHITER